jgi:hypothetical protein
MRTLEQYAKPTSELQAKNTTNLTRCLNFNCAKWIIQLLGRGYKIKNHKYGVYLAAPGDKLGTIVGISETPTVWTLVRTQAGFA